jgi:hypothetical protein
MLRHGLVALGFTCSAHVALTAANLCNAVFATQHRLVTAASQSATDTCGLGLELDQPGPSGRAETLQTTVELMYEKSLVPESRWAPGSTFEDPAAACAGHAEIAEAFRALAALKPEQAGARQLSEFDGASRFTFTQKMKYSLAGRQIALESVVVVDDDGNGRVTAMKELWNGNELFFLGSLSRRVNGLLSFYVTKLLL